MRTFVTLLALSIAAPVGAGAGPLCGTAPIGVHKSGFETAEVAPPPYVPNPPLPSDATPVTLSVTYPGDGIAVGTSSIQVYGTFTGPANTGVSINDAAALQSGSSFLSRSVPLEPGANVVAIKVTSAAGVTQTVNRSVTYNPVLAPDLELRSVHLGDFAPFSLRFTVALRPGIATPVIERIRLDFDGDSTFDVDTTDPNERLTHRYQAPGLYVATAEVTLTDSPPVVVTATHRVMGENLDVTRASLCKAFETHRAHLAAQQYTDALQVFNAEVRPDYADFIMGLGSNGPTVAAGLGEIADGAIGQDVAELVLARPIPGEPGRFFRFPLQFSRDADGVWRISAL